jgi:hypothetical protein
MRLPPELRLMVYQFALRDITNPIMFPGSGEVQKPQLSRVAFALLEASKFIRYESYHAMRKNASRNLYYLCAAFKAVGKRSSEVKASVDILSSAWEQATNEFDRAYRQTECIRVITRALGRAMSAHFAELQAQFEKEYGTI